MKITGKITHILETKTGISKDGKEWHSLEYRVEETSGEYPQSAILSIFGKEKIENFNKYNKLNDVVEVEYTLKSNEYQGKFYNKLNSFRVNKKIVKQENTDYTEAIESNNDLQDDLPF